MGAPKLQRAVTVQFPEKEKREIFTPEQIQELKKPLEHSDDLQLVIREFGDDL